MKNLVAIVFILFIFAAVACGQNAITPNPHPPAGPSGGQPDAVGCGTTSLTQSTSQTVLYGNSAACNAGGLHTDNYYARGFSLPGMGITRDFDICAVQIGVETATSANGSQPLEVHLYRYNVPNFPPESWIGIGSAVVQIPDQTLTVFTIPVTATVPAGWNLAVEIFTPNGQTAGNSFFIGSNNLGQSAPSYIKAADCGVNSYMTTAGIGFPDMHIVMNVDGTEAAPPIPAVNLVGLLGLLSLIGAAGVYFLVRRTA